MRYFSIIISIVLFAIRYFYYQDLIISAIGLAFTLWIFVRFIYLLGKEFPIKEFILTITSFQWILGAKISYLQGKVHYKYYMYVDESAYMTFIVISVLCFAMGLFLIRIPIDFQKLFDFGANAQSTIKSKALYLIAIGLGSTFLSSYFVISGLGFVLYLINLFVYVGAAYLMVAYPQRRFWVFFISVGYIFIKSLLMGLFHDLFLVGGFLLFFLFRPTTTFFTKISLILVGSLIIYIVQIVKKDYREFIWNTNDRSNSFEIFADLLINEFSGSTKVDVNYINREQAERYEESEVNARLNQGWIISKVMYNIPKNKPFLHGETIRESLISAILPRFLAPDKAGGDYAKEVFQEVTGLRLSGGTSMGLSVSGEFYANYGIIGGWIAIFLYGMTIAGIVKFICNNLGWGSSLIFCWFLFFFFQTVKAESNFITVFNHLTKAIVLFIIFKMILRQFNINLLMNSVDRSID